MFCISICAICFQASGGTGCGALRRSVLGAAGAESDIPHDVRVSLAAPCVSARGHPARCCEHSHFCSFLYCFEDTLVAVASSCRRLSADGYPFGWLFLLLIQGLLLLIVSFIQMPSSAGDSSLPALDAMSGGAAAAAAARVAAVGAGGTGSSGGPKGGAPGTLKAFEMAESSDCSETSLLRSLLSAAVPVQLQVYVRKFHVNFWSFAVLSETLVFGQRRLCLIRA